MPRFVIERELGGVKLSEEDLRQGALKSLAVLREMSPGIQWITSFVTDDKVYCIYWADDESAIREHGRLAGIPVDRVAAVRRMLEPAEFE